MSEPTAGDLPGGFFSRPALSALPKTPISGMKATRADPRAGKLMGSPRRAEN
jgi:hypothetical protein